MKKPNIDLRSQARLASLPVCIAAALATTALQAAPNNPPSFDPGFNPTSTPCDGDVSFTEWAQNVTDGDGGTSRVDFRITGVSNPDIFSTFPFVSWPSRTLTYTLKPGTPAGESAVITAVLIDSSGTGQGGSDTSEPRSWTIFTEGCTDVDLDGIADEIDPDISIRIDTDGDGMFDDEDMDDDNDGIPDDIEGNGLVDTDSDGIPDSLDLDSDNDGLMDVDEAGNTAADTNGDGMIDGAVDDNGMPLNGSGEVTDSDGDGIPDSQEPNGVDVSTDTDGDGITDDLDADDDGDGVSDVDEGTGDSNGDGIPDSLDPDTDGSQTVTVQSGPVNAIVETGLSGGGCTLSSGGGFDPLLPMLSLLALLGVRRRKLK